MAGFGVLDFNLVEELERNDAIPMVSYRFTVPLSLGGVGTGVVRGLLKLNWLETVSRERAPPQGAGSHTC